MIIVYVLPLCYYYINKTKNYQNYLNSEAMYKILTDSNHGGEY